MADNILTSEGDTAATNDIAGVHYSRSKITLGAAGVNDGDVASGNPMPITGTAASGAAMPGVQVVIAGFDSAGNVTKSIEVTDNGEILVRVQNLTAMTDGDRSQVIYDGVTAVQVKHAVIDNATSGDNTLVAAVTDKKIRVISLFLVASDAVTIRFESGAGGTALSGQMVLTGSGGFTLPRNQDGWFETAASALLNLELSGAVSVDGFLTYIEAD